MNHRPILKGSLLVTVALFFAGPLLAHANTTGTFATGDAAVDALGQYDDNLTDPSPIYVTGGAQGGMNRLGFSNYFNINDMAVDTVHHRLFIPDTTQGRIFIYNLNTDNSLIDLVPDNVLGGLNFYTTNSTTTLPIAVAYDSVHDRLFVAQVVASGILVFDTSHITNGMSAQYIIGRPDLTTSYGASAATASGTSIAPYGLAYDSTHNRLFASDYYFNRVMAYDLDNIATGMNASYVLGQPNFTSTTSATTGSGMNIPFGLAYDNTHQRLYVADTGNNRVLVFSGATLSNGMTARYVLGQTSATGSTATTTRAGLSGPAGVTIDETGNRLFVGDHGNSRVLTYNLNSLATGMNAANVLGQADFTHAATATTQSGFNLPAGVLYEPTTHDLYVSDVNNNRYLVFDATSITDGENAIDGLGQYDDNASNPGFVFTKGNAQNAPSQYGFSNPRSATVDATHHRLFVADSANNRVLVYNLTSSNVLNDRLPDFVLGQANFHTNAAATTAVGLSAPHAVAYDSATNHIIVADKGNNRIVIFSGSTLSSGMTANTVLGQTNFTSGGAATTRAGLSAPQGLFFDDTNSRLLVADTGNHRVLSYSTATLSNGMNAANVLGQADFTHAATATTNIGMNGPIGVSYDASNARLFVADSGNNRVLVFTGSTLSDSMSAGYVLGQTDFTTATAATTKMSMRNPAQIAYDGAAKRLIVADNGNNRVTIFSITANSLATGMDADSVLGQTSFTASGAAVTQTGMNGPSGVTYDATSNHLYVTDAGYNRVLVFSDAVTASSSSSATSSSVEGPTQSAGGRRGGGGGQTIAPAATVPSTIPQGLPDTHNTTLLPESPSSLSVTVNGQNVHFTDVPLVAWYATYIKTLIEAGIASGYKDANGNLLGIFGPNRSVTYAEIAKMALSAARKEVDSNAVPLNRSARNDWSASYIATAESRHLSVYTPTLDTRDSATRGAVIQTMLEAFGVPVEHNLQNIFTDLPQNSPYAAAILTAAKLGLISGDTDTNGQSTGTVRSNEPINRAEIAKILVLARKLFAE